jgi:hypothetical protein
MTVRPVAVRAGDGDRPLDDGARRFDLRRGPQRHSDAA